MATAKHPGIIHENLAMTCNVPYLPYDYERIGNQMLSFLVPSLVD